MPRRPASLALWLVLPLLAGCGADGASVDGAGPAEVAGPVQGTAPFPVVHGVQLADIASGLPGGLRATPRSGPLRVGSHRVTFTLRDQAGTPLQLARVAVYTARGDGSGVRGPYRAASRAVEAIPPGAQDGDRLAAASSVYVASVPVRRTGRMLVGALVEVDGRLMAAAPFALPVE